MPAVFQRPSWPTMMVLPFSVTLTVSASGRPAEECAARAVKYAASVLFRKSREQPVPVEGLPPPPPVVAGAPLPPTAPPAPLPPGPTVLFEPAVPPAPLPAVDVPVLPEPASLDFAPALLVGAPALLPPMPEPAEPPCPSLAFGASLLQPASTRSVAQHNCTERDDERTNFMARPHAPRA